MSDKALVAWVPRGSDWTEEGVRSIGGSFCTGWMQKNRAESICNQLSAETKGAAGKYITVYKER